MPKLSKSVEDDECLDEDEINESEDRPERRVVKRVDGEIETTSLTGYEER